ncbi:MAG: histidine kinase [Nitrosopumilus sp.]
MKTPDTVPDKITHPINPIIIIVILATGIGAYVSMNTVSEENVGIIAFIISVSLAAGVSISAFIVSKHNETGVLAKSYFVLGIGFMSYVIAEVLYYSLEEIFGIDPYPSFADIFFFAVYPFTLIHLFLNIRYFNSGFTKFQTFVITVIPIIASLAYTILSITVADAELGFDFYYGLIFVVAASTTLAFAIVGALTFRTGALGVVWLLLVLGLMVNAAGDVWYYHLEIFGKYFDAHPVTIVWFIANMFMIYALYKHLKII